MRRCRGASCVPGGSGVRGAEALEPLVVVVDVECVDVAQLVPAPAPTSLGDFPAGGRRVGRSSAARTAAHQH